jgi:hypothetical protein
MTAFCQTFVSLETILPNNLAQHSHRTSFSDRPSPNSHGKGNLTMTYQTESLGWYSSQLLQATGFALTIGLRFLPGVGKVANRVDLRCSLMNRLHLEF